MKVYLRDQNQKLVDAWLAVFENEPDVVISCGDIFAPGQHLDVQAITSPANSYGFLDGGIDFVYSQYFGWGVEEILRTMLWQKHNGELLVGQAEIIDMRQTNPKNELHAERVQKIPYLISAPTMRVPMDISKTTNAYLAFVATLRLAKQSGIESILCPGLGTAIGKMQPEICAIQMYEAWKTYDKPRFYDVLGVAHVAHYSLLDPEIYFSRTNQSNATRICVTTENE
jgi:O-acetyl-ADP-ribose deacetylase (regulator of RNase III)